MDVRIRLSKTSLADEVSFVRKTLGGNLYIQLKKKSTRTDDVRSVAETSSGAKSTKASRIAALKIRGMNGDITCEELTAAISVRMQIPTLKVRVKVMKTGYAGRIMAVVIVPARATNIHVRGSSLQKGWSSCTAKIRV